MNSQLPGSTRPRPTGALAAGKKAIIEKPGGEFVLSIQVVNEYTKKPIGDAECEVLDPKGKKLGAPKTDWKGNFELPVPAPGSYTVRVLKVPKAPKKEKGGEGAGAVSGGA